MDWSEIAAGWLKMKDAARLRWGRLDNTDLEAIGGDKDIFAQRLQERYGFTRDEAEAEVQRWADGLTLVDERSRLLDEIERLKAEVTNFAKVAGDEIREGADQASAKANEFAKEFESAIERNPMQAALIAAGIGLIIGLLTRSNR